jgi:hypothetical protein
MEREIRPNGNLESVVYTLLAAKARGEHVYCNFNGHQLHSDSVTMDSAYQEVCGHTKAEYDEILRKRNEEYKRQEEMEKEKATKNIPNWIERGERIIFPERYEDWTRCVKVRSEDLYHGMDLDAALEIMEAIENGASMEEANKIFEDQNHSGMSAGVVRSMAFHFSSKGPEFLEASAWHEISEEDKKVLEAKKAENVELAARHSSKKM